jgi:transposase-like protein
MTLAAMSEDDARAMIERIRWPDGPTCPHCGAIGEFWKLDTRPGLYKCKGCRKQYTVTVGTIFHRSHITLKQWVIAFHLMCSSKKGISALQLQRELGLASYQSAWHLAHRVRHAMKQEPFAGKLSGDVEADEMYVGGKPRDPFLRKRGRGTTKTAVAVLVQRDGAARARAVDRVDGDTLKGFIRENVKNNATIFTDEWSAYRGIGKEFKGGHYVVNHKAGQYAIPGGVHSNTAECFNGLFKRAVMGAWHNVSRQHIQRYLDEASFRWGSRRMSDGDRLVMALRQADGKRLTYGTTKSSEA